MFMSAVLIFLPPFLRMQWLSCLLELIFFSPLLFVLSHLKKKGLYFYSDNINTLKMVIFSKSIFSFLHLYHYYNMCKGLSYYPGLFIVDE